MKSHEKKLRVVVAMSGGVDSSVAAALLRDQGHEVIGISLKLWDYDEPEREKSGKTCCSLEDIADAKSVCDTLGIPFYAFNHKKAFQEKVIEPFVDSYLNARTPNPCVLCNQHLKFGLLLQEAKKMGASHLATGHYARITQDDQGTYHLCRSRDLTKDQSYVLFHLKQDELAQILFPLGDLTKDEVRELASKYALVTRDKRESQDICFIPDNDHARFIKKYTARTTGPGHFLDTAGNVLGVHEGLECYTVGQRKGLKFSAGRRLYVSELRPETNEVILADEEAIWQDGLWARGFHFLGEKRTGILGAKIRYQRDEIPARIECVDDGRVRLSFPQKARAITPGQAVVLYDGDEVVGGGWIESGFDC